MSVAARSVTARKLLSPREFPEELRYLYEWSLALHRQSGVGMAGFLPLTYSTIADWSRLEDVDVYPHEVQALLTLDRVMLYPSEEFEEAI